MRSRQFRSWLHYHAHTVLGQPVTPTVALEAIYTMEGHAQHAGPLYPLAVRVAASKGALWYDLGGKAVRVTAEGWEVIDRPPMLFRRFHHQQAQVEPQHGGTLALLAPLLPSSMTDAQRLLFTVSLVTGLVPDIPQTVDVIFGDHGSAKSTLTKVKKALLNPSVLDECRRRTSVRRCNSTPRPPLVRAPRQSHQSAGVDVGLYQPRQHGQWICQARTLRGR